MVEKVFVIPVERRWKLLVLPILAILYFVALILLVAFGYEIEGVPLEYLVLAGVGLFCLVILIELPFFLKKRVREAPVEEEALDQDVYVDEPLDMPVEPTRGPVITGDEYVLTTETANGLRVLEYSYPAKSMNHGAVYAKTFVPVTKEHVLRIEDLGADASEL